MSERSKISLGIISVFPLVWFFIFIIAVVSMTLFGSDSPVSVIAFLFINMFTVWLTFILVGYYVLHALKNESFSTSSKTAWVIAIVLGCIITMPVYWFINIRTKPIQEMPV